MGEREQMTDKVLSEIRIEIERHRDSLNKAISEDELTIDGMKKAYDDVLEILDKHLESVSK